MGEKKYPFAYIKIFSLENLTLCIVLTLGLFYMVSNNGVQVYYHVKVMP